MPGKCELGTTHPDVGVLSGPSGHSLLLQCCQLRVPCFITLGVLNFSVPELHKLVLQGKKCIKWHKYLLIVYSALVPVQGREVGSLARQVPLTSAVLCVCNTLLGELTNELLNSINSMPQNNFCLKVITDN